MQKNLDKLLAVQLEFQAAIEEDQERCYELAASLGSGESVSGGIQSFGVLLEMAINRLKS
ncbi:hypothetical protein JG688_00017830 [Phytophthora aleatoria]|uniref:Uncharacterized protein n=1 Tax=Phytophthora aleatoria TaxID=2496075 RepID=A0A8J5I4X3_9STRA|nr:hypothetical protein JG688_00017830 [Phytophthora aleatoria]